MTFLGEEQGQYDLIVYLVFASIAAIFACFQLFFLQQMKILPVYMLPLLSLCLCYENVVMALGTRIEDHSIVANIAYAVHAIEAPAFVIIMYEAPYRLHEARMAHFFFFPFDQGAEFSSFTPYMSLVLVRGLAVALLVLGLIVNFEIVDHSDEGIRIGGGGYSYLAEHASNYLLWLGLIPPMVLSVFALLMGFVVYRYGNNLTIAVLGRRRWRFPLICAIGQAGAHIFGVSLFPIMSNAGELLLLLGSTVLIYLVQEDLSLAGSFADYLHKSNIAFSRLGSGGGVGGIAGSNSAGAGGGENGGSSSLHSPSRIPESPAGGNDDVDPSSQRGSNIEMSELYGRQSSGSEFEQNSPRFAASSKLSVK